MTERIKKIVSLDTTAATISELELNIPLPDGQAIRIDSVSVLIEANPFGTGETEGVNVAVMAKASNLSTLTLTDLETAPEVIALGSLNNYLGSTSVKPKGAELNVSNEPYALNPRVAIGQRAFVPLGPVVDALFIIDYDIVKLSTKVATSLAAR